MTSRIISFHFLSCGQFFLFSFISTRKFLAVVLEDLLFK